MSDGVRPRVTFDAPLAAWFRTRDWQPAPFQREVWRRYGDIEGGRREIFVLDPDGYLVMLARDLGTRPLQQ